MNRNLFGIIILVVCVFVCGLIASCYKTVGSQYILDRQQAIIDSLEQELKWTREVSNAKSYQLDQMEEWFEEHGYVPADMFDCNGL